MLGTFTVRLFHGGHTQPVEQFNVLLRTCAHWLTKEHFKHAVSTGKYDQY